MTIQVLKIIYITGGTQNSCPHLIYIPVTLSAYFFNFYGGLMGGIISGIGISFLPFNTYEMIYQTKDIWISRLFFLTIFGIFIGYLFEKLRNQFYKLENLLKYDPISNLPKRNVLVSDLKNLIREEKNFFLGSIYIENIREIFNLVGPSKEEIILKSISNYFRENKIENKIKIYNSNSLNFEFLIPNHEKYDIENWVNLFVDKLKTTPLIIESHSIFFNFSIGITCSNKNYVYPDSYIRESYEALEYAYNNSLDTCIYDSNLENHYLTTYLVSQVDNAIENNEFYIEYQPKLDLKDNQIDGLEALVRWNHSKLGKIAPNEFIPKLEKTNSIIKVTQYIIKKVIEDIRYLKTKDINLNIAINVCPRDLNDVNFNFFLLNELEKNNIHPNRVQLEVTETDFISNLNLIIKNLKLLSENGIKISIDDFGTGYSSLSYLNTLPVDYIKIDRSLIKNITRDVKKKNLINDTIKLAHNLNKIVVAEGVEDEETMNLLRKLDCEKIQGYYIAKPMSVNELEKFILNYAFCCKKYAVVV